MKKIPFWCLSCLWIFLVITLSLSCVRSRPFIRYDKLRSLPKLTAQDVENLSPEVKAVLILRDEQLKSHILTLEGKIDKYNESVGKSYK